MDLLNTGNTRIGQPRIDVDIACSKQYHVKFLCLPGTASIDVDPWGLGVVALLEARRCDYTRSGLETGVDIQLCYEDYLLDWSSVVHCCNQYCGLQRSTWLS